MEKLIYTYLLMAVLTILVNRQRLVQMDSKKKIAPISILFYSWAVTDTAKNLISNYYTNHGNKK